MAFCRKCGKQARTGAKFCPGCGAAIGEAQVPPKSWPRRKTVAAAAICALLIIASTAAYFAGIRSRKATLAAAVAAPSAPPSAAVISQQSPPSIPAPTLASSPPLSAPAAPPARSAPDSISPGMMGEIFPQTRLRILSAPDIDSWSYSQVRYAINEIYARHGYLFTTKSLSKQFQKFPWYHPAAGRTHQQAQNLFTPIEKANLVLLARRRLALQKQGKAAR